jgi:hypothetical protein
MAENRQRGTQLQWEPARWDESRGEMTQTHFIAWGETGGNQGGGEKREKEAKCGGGGGERALFRIPMDPHFIGSPGTEYRSALVSGSGSRSHEHRKNEILFFQ